MGARECRKNQGIGKLNTLRHRGHGPSEPGFVRRIFRRGKVTGDFVFLVAMWDRFDKRQSRYESSSRLPFARARADGGRLVLFWAADGGGCEQDYWPRRDACGQDFAQ